MAGPLSEPMTHIYVTHPQWIKVADFICRCSFIVRALCKMTAIVKNRVTSPCLLAIVLLITAGHFTANTNNGGQELPGGLDNSKQNKLECDEHAPICDVEHNRTNRTYRNRFRDNGSGLSAIVVGIKINANSQSICTLDPLNNVSDIIKGITEIVELVLVVSCSENTRVILRPGRNVSSPNVMVFLKIENCTVYWKDIQQLNNYAHIEGMILVDWKDEFEANPGGYFDECVKLTRFAPSLINQALNDSEPIFYISGLVHVGGLIVSSNMLRTVSPAFTRYQWPSVAELVFMG